MNDDHGSSFRFRRYEPKGRHRDNRQKGAWAKPLLWLGIAACLLASVLFVTGKGSDTGIQVSTLQLSADDAATDAAQSKNIFEDSIVDPRLILGTEMPVIYGLDLEEVYTDEDMDAPERPDINFDVLPEDVRLEILRYSNDPKKPFEVGSDGPQILIYHTHTREAYMEGDASLYNVGEYQTTDWTHSVAAVGEVLKSELESYGFSVIHDTTDHVPPKQSTAYSRSLQTMQDYKKQYPSLQIFIDLHRDAYGNGYPAPEAGQKDYVTVDGAQCARMMFVVGTGENYDGAEKPNYESNYKLAQALTDKMNNICDGIMRPIRVKPGRYNQQVTDMCLLIEVGHNANTLDQAKNAVKQFALALSQVVKPNGS